MKKFLGLILVVAVVIVTAPHARGLGAPSAPRGVASSDWIPLGDSAGFVVSHEESPPDASRPSGVVRGYFMVRRDQAWLRVDSGPGLKVHPATFDR